MATALAKRNLAQDPKASDEHQVDEDLLERFLGGGESESQEAFRALVIRHGPAVLGVCRRVLEAQQDAEDVFQATFLVLARKAGTIRNRKLLAGWLYEVAHRMAVKARGQTFRRRNLERQAAAMSPRVIVESAPELSASLNELRPILHAEVDRLPERYRAPVILSYLEGKTNEEVADLLNWPVGTVKGRLSRARELLRTRLGRRGLVLSTAFILTVLSQERESLAASTLSTELVERTVQLVGRAGRRSFLAGRYADKVGATRRAAIAPRIVSLTSSIGVQRRVMRYGVYLLLFALIATSISAATAAYVQTPAGHSAIHSAIARWLPARTGGQPCRGERE